MSLGAMVGITVVFIGIVYAALELSNARQSFVVWYGILVTSSIIDHFTFVKFSYSGQVTLR